MQRPRATFVIALLLPWAAASVLAAETSPPLAEQVALVENAEAWDAAASALAEALTTVRDHQGDDAEIVQLLDRLGVQAWRLGEPRVSVELLSRAFAAHAGEGKAGVDPARQAATRVSQHLERLGDLKGAEAWVRKSLELGTGDARDYRSRVDYRRLGRLISEARPEDAEALEAYERGVAHETAEARARELAGFLAGRGEHAAAIRPFREALRAASPEREWSLRRDLAASLSAVGEHDLAAIEYQEALRVAGRVFGERDLELVHLYRQVGEFHLAQQDYPQADIHLRAAYEMAQLFYGDCPTCSRSLLQALRTLYDATELPFDFCGPEGRPEPEGETGKPIAELDGEAADLQQRRQSARAREVALRALELRAEAYGENSIEYAKGLYELLRASPALGDSDERAELHKRRIEILQPYLEGDELAVTYDLVHLGIWAKERGDTEAAAEYWLRAAYAQDRHNRNLALVQTLDRLADLAAEEGDLRQAAEHRQWIVDTWERMAERDSARYLRALLQLVEIYRELGRADEAGQLLVDLLEAYRENPYLDAGKIEAALEEHRQALHDPR